MDILLSNVTKQAMNYAIRSGIAITSTYAIRQCSRLLKTVDGQLKEELSTLQLRLESKIRIISPAIDMIDLIAARGNTSLESAVSLTKSLRWDIQSLGARLAHAATDDERQKRGCARAKPVVQHEAEIKDIIAEMKKMIARIEDAVPLINLAITTSGASLSTTLPATVSPSRLLQASTFLTAGDAQYSADPTGSGQVGPVFTLSIYMLFAGHTNRPVDEAGIRETTWKEVIHKAHVKLLRVPLAKVYHLPEADGGPTRRYQSSNGTPSFEANSLPSQGHAFEYAYQLLIIEDLDDDRVHTFEDDELRPGPYADVASAGIKEILPIHEISKIFYADTGKILNIGSEGEANSPILLLKRDVNAAPPRRTMESQTLDTDEEEVGDTASFAQEKNGGKYPHNAPAAHQWRFPPNLDLEWIALEVFREEPSSEDEEEPETTTEAPSSSPVSARPPGASRSTSLDPSLTSSLAGLNLHNGPSPSPQPTINSQLILSPQTAGSIAHQHQPATALPLIRTSLSLLEMLIRLTALQQFQQQSHLSIPDELLNFFLSESSTVGAGGDAELRRRVRNDAARRVGFDPYDESPIKRRGEDYVAQHHYGSQYGSVPGSPAMYDGGGWAQTSQGTGTPAGEFSDYVSGSHKGYSSGSGYPFDGFSSPTPAPMHSPRPTQQRVKSAEPKSMSPATPPPNGKVKMRTDALRRDGGPGREVSPLARSSSVEEDEKE